MWGLTAKAAISRSRAWAGGTPSATGHAGDAITSGLEVTWSQTPTKWSNNFFENLFGFEWELTKSPAGASQWKPKDDAGAGTVPHAHDPSKRIAPSMLTTDLALRFDPAYEKISRRFLANPGQFADAFARAWFKLTHRDMARAPAISGLKFPGKNSSGRIHSAINHPLIDAQDIASSRAGSSLRVCPFRNWSPPPGVGFHLPWLRQARRRERRPHSPRAAEGLGSQPTRQLDKVLGTLTRIQGAFNSSQSSGKKVSLADLIVLAGCAAVEQAAKNAVTT